MKTVKEHIKEVIRKYCPEEAYSGMAVFKENIDIRLEIFLKGLSTYSIEEQGEILRIYKEKNSGSTCIVSRVIDEDGDIIKIPDSMLENLHPMIRFQLNERYNSYSLLLLTLDEFESAIKERKKAMEENNYYSDESKYYGSIPGNLFYGFDFKIPDMDYNQLNTFMNELFLGHTDLAERYAKNNYIYSGKIQKLFKDGKETEAINFYYDIPKESRKQIKAFKSIYDEDGLKDLLKFKSLHYIDKSFTDSSSNILWNLPKKDPNYFMTAIYATYIICYRKDKSYFKKIPNYAVEKAGKYYALAKMLNFDWKKVKELIIKDNPEAFSGDLKED